MNVHMSVTSAVRIWTQPRWSTATAVFAVVAVLLTPSCKRCSAGLGIGARSEPVKVPSVTRVWCVDDSVRVGRAPGQWSRVRGRSGHVWEPKTVVHLVGLPGETIAFQVVLVAGKGGLTSAKVELPNLKAEHGDVLSGVPAPGTSFAAIETFVVYDVPVPRRSGGKDYGESLGWVSGAQPDDPSVGRAVPDALLPIAHASTWGEYPLHANPGHARVVWVDVTLPQALPAGAYRGELSIRYREGGADAASVKKEKFPVVIDVGGTKLPYAAAKTMVYFEPGNEVEARVGSAKAITHAFQVMHRHHLSPIVDITKAEDVLRYREALDGTLYTQGRGYDGPGQGVGADVVAIGAYGIMGDPTDAALGRAESILETLAQMGIGDNPGKRDIFLYAVDEQCDSPRGPQWRAALHKSKRPMLPSLRVGHTCSEPPAQQPVDLPIVFAEKYDTKLAQKARSAGKHVWIYNGVLPRTGSFLTDSWGLSLRANAWIQARYGIERWFYWEATFWNDGNQGGWGPHDPFKTAETFHNQHGDHCNGDGLLLYPGTQVKGRGMSLGILGVVSSIRLKQWRRGIEDAGYLRLASKGRRAQVDQMTDALVGETLEHARGDRPPWAGQGKMFYDARRKLFRMINDQAH